MAASPRSDGPLPELERSELARYARHLVLPEVGVEGQRRLKAGSVLLIGLGGLGSPAALYLAAAGIGRLGLVDWDDVEASNLHRQVIHGTSDIGRPKLESARDRVVDLNPHVEVVLHPLRLDSSNALGVIGPYDIVIDGSDNFPTRYLVNDACVLVKRPYVYGAIHRFEGQVSVFAAPEGPCYRCLFREPPPPGLVPSCAEGGVLGVLPGVIGSLQALEAIKWILGRGDSAAGRLLLFDALELDFRTLEIRRDPLCPVCGDQPTVTELIDYDAFCGLGPSVDESAGREVAVPEVTPLEVKRRIEAGEPLTLVDVREAHEWELSNLEEFGARWIPLADIASRADELRDAQGPLVLYCRGGGRSRRAARELKEVGIVNVENLEGGIVGWERDVDSSSSDS